MWRWTMRTRCCRRAVWARALWCTCWRRRRVRWQIEQQRLLLPPQLRVDLQPLQRLQRASLRNGGMRSSSSGVAAMPGAAHHPPKLSRANAHFLYECASHIRRLRAVRNIDNTVHTGLDIVYETKFEPTTTAFIQPFRVYMYPSTHLFIAASLSLSLCLSAFASACHLSVFPSACPSARLSPRLSVSMSASVGPIMSSVSDFRRSEATASLIVLRARPCKHAT